MLINILQNQLELKSKDENQNSWLARRYITENQQQHSAWQEV